MREIKFRGKRVSFGNWVYGYFWKDIRSPRNQHYIRLLDSSETVEVIPESVGQATGLKDKEGVDGFKKDIVEFSWKKSKGYGETTEKILRGVIEETIFKHSCIMVKGKEYHIDCLLRGKIIGNLTDNPDLVKEGKAMKCYVCKNKIDVSVRVFMPPKDRREKDNYRDLCKKCYKGDMEAKGYVLEKGIWKNKKRQKG